MSSPNYRLTTPDLVLLSLLTEKEQHGYELNTELERREVRDWAGVSRPQIYYSLKKLAEQKLIEPVPTTEQKEKYGTGPERQVYRITEAGHRALETGLARSDWATQEVLSPFLTWIALSPYASTETITTMLETRSEFLEHRLEEETRHLQMIHEETHAPPGVVQIATLMVEHKIALCRIELEWMERVSQTF